MKLVTFFETIYSSFKKSAGAHHAIMDATRSYVISSHQIGNLLRDHEALRERVYRISDLEPRLAPFHVSTGKVGTQRVLVYNGSGGYGDQIMTWPLAKLLSDLGLEVSIMADPGNTTCWSVFPWVKMTLTLPVPYELFQMFDYHIIMEVVSNADEHTDQLHTVDTMLTKVGIDPRSIPAERKVVAPIFTHGEMKAMMGAFPDKSLAFYQLSAASHLRSFTPDESANKLAVLATTFPEWHWLALHDDFISKEYAEKAKALNMANVQTMCHPVLRELWALVKRANVVVAPDSMMVHVAGSMGVPCVGMWGLMDPTKRVAYYQRHKALFFRQACPHAPCHTYGGDWPRYCPQRDTRKQCDVLAAITDADLVKAVCEVTGSPARDPGQRNSDKAIAIWTKEGARKVDAPAEVSAA